MNSSEQFSGEKDGPTSGLRAKRLMDVQMRRTAAYRGFRGLIFLRKEKEKLVFRFFFGFSDILILIVQVEDFHRKYLSSEQSDTANYPPHQSLLCLLCMAMATSCLIDEK